MQFRGQNSPWMQRDVRRGLGNDPLPKGLISPQTQFDGEIEA